MPVSTPLFPNIYSPACTFVSIFGDRTQFCFLELTITDWSGKARCRLIKGLLSLTGVAKRDVG